MTVYAKDRRKHARIDRSFRVEYVVNGRRSMAFVVNLSMGGMYLRSASQLTEGDQEDFMLALSSDAEPLTLRARVIDCAANHARVQFLPNAPGMHALQSYFETVILPELESAVEGPRPDVMKLSLLARLYHEFGRASEALNLYRKARAAAPSDGRLLDHMALFLLRVAESEPPYEPDVLPELDTLVAAGLVLGSSETLGQVKRAASGLMELRRRVQQDAVVKREEERQNARFEVELQQRSKQLEAGLQDKRRAVEEEQRAVARQAMEVQDRRLQLEAWVADQRNTLEEAQAAQVRQIAELQERSKQLEIGFAERQRALEGEFETRLATQQKGLAAERSALTQQQATLQERETRVKAAEAAETARAAAMQAEMQTQHDMLQQRQSAADAAARGQQEAAAQTQRVAQAAEGARLDSLRKDLESRQEALAQQRREVLAEREAWTQERARVEAQERARAEAQERARVEAQERARVEAQERARIEAQERAHAPSLGAAEAALAAAKLELSRRQEDLAQQRSAFLAERESWQRERAAAELQRSREMAQPPKAQSEIALPVIDPEAAVPTMVGTREALGLVAPSAAALDPDPEAAVPTMIGTREALGLVAPPNTAQAPDPEANVPTMIGTREALGLVAPPNSAHEPHPEVRQDALTRPAGVLYSPESTGPVASATLLEAGLGTGPVATASLFEAGHAADPVATDDFLSAPTRQVFNTALVEQAARGAEAAHPASASAPSAESAVPAAAPEHAEPAFVTGALFEHAGEHAGEHAVLPATESTEAGAYEDPAYWKRRRGPGLNLPLILAAVVIVVVLGMWGISLFLKPAASELPQSSMPANAAPDHAAVPPAADAPSPSPSPSPAPAHAPSHSSGGAKHGSKPAPSAGSKKPKNHR